MLFTLFTPISLLTDFDFYSTLHWPRCTGAYFCVLQLKTFVQNWSDVLSPWEWCCDFKRKKKFCTWNVQQWWWFPCRDPPGMTMPAPPGLSKLQPRAAYSCEHVCLPKAAGDSRMPEQSPEGTMIEPKWSRNGQRAAWSPNCTTRVKPPRDRWGPRSPWWRWCRRGCKSSWRRAWRAGRRADSRWRCSSRSQVSGRRRKWHQVERRRWCAPCCSGPAASESPGSKEEERLCLHASNNVTHCWKHWGIFTKAEFRLTGSVWKKGVVSVFTLYDHCGKNI